MTNVSDWTCDSWKRPEFELKQQPIWPDKDALDKVLKQLRNQPPLIYAGEARVLKAELAKVARGEAFVLQAGDCAETFHEFSADRVKNGLKIILQMAIVLTYSSRVPTVKIGRIAGQFGKPRTADYEVVNDMKLPVYRGDMINNVHPSIESRNPDPENILRAYQQSVITLNLLRGFAKGGFADLEKVHEWNREFILSSSEGHRYEELADKIESALQFLRACNIDVPAMHEVDIYTSHEALILDYEASLTRQDSTFNNDWYDCSAHMLWIGKRTAESRNSAHIEFLRGVGNPIGIKISSEMKTDDLLWICDRLNPNREPGRLTLISRMGEDKVLDALPNLVTSVTNEGHKVVWICDPMHGNTFTSESGLKTRNFDSILSEIEKYFSVHKECGTWPGGVHLELTGDNVTECLGGSDNIEDSDLYSQYNTACDPRLNARQSLDLAFQIANLLESCSIK
jgi:3-deoxy-7-phosphoheptulonate synthase